MNIYGIIKIIQKQLKWLICMPIIMAGIMYLATANQTHLYSTKGTLFTAIASGSTLSNLGNNRVDFFASKTAYNNLITIINSRKVIEETSLRLLAMHLMLKESKAVILSQISFQALQENIPQNVKELAHENDSEITFNNLQQFLQQDKTNYLYGLLNFDHPHYSHKAISSIKTRLVDGSDIIELSYQSDDPAIAYHTLNILISVFLKEYSNLKVNQASSVISYFEKQLRKSAGELNNAEDRLLNFNKENQIINYYEQTKHISSQQEKIQIKLHDIVMEFDAAEAILARLEDETQSRFNINLKTKDIINIRESLIDVNKNIASLEMRDNMSEETADQKLKLLTNKNQLENLLRNKIDSLYIYEKRSDGIAIDNLLDNWLQNVINYESAKARLMAMKTKSEEFDQLFNQFAPLGASLKRIEREIEVKEKSYLEILHHLGLARLKQQNEELMANMKILDAPFLPIDAEPTKRKIMIAAIGIFTFLFTLLGFFAFELLDRTIKAPQRLENLSKYKVIGATASQKKKNVDLETLNIKGLKPPIDIINAKLSGRSNQKPTIIQIFSYWNNEGKSNITFEICNKLTELNYTTLIISFGKEEEPFTHNHIQVAKKQLNGTDYQSLVADITSYDAVIVEIPPLSDQHFFANPTLFQSADLNFLIADASRNWSKSDDFIKEHFEQQTQIKPYAILTRTLPENMEDLIGEIPKKRSKLRRFIKNQILKRYLI